MDNLELRKFLINIGISSNVIGYFYIIRAVEIIANQKIHTNMMTIYQIIAKEEQSTISAVERAIRHAIKKSYNKFEILHKIYNCIPDNSVFVYDLVFNFDVIKSYIN